MAQVKVFYDDIGGTLSVWWGNPKDEEVCEINEHDIILIKDKDGEVIGLEKLHYSGGDPKDFAVEAKTAEDYMAVNAP